MKAGELFQLLTNAQCGDEVFLEFEKKKIRVDELSDNSEGEFILEGSEYTEVDSDEE